MRYLLPLLLLLSMLTVLLPGCEPKEELITTDAAARLAFSTDTVKFDTVFVQTGTVTKRLWVYNRNKRAVRVSEIRLAAQQGATYQLIIGGDPGAVARDVEIRGQDSLLVLVKATLQPGADKPFLVEDQLLFRTNGNEQLVRLIAYGQNAYFHRHETIDRNTTWAADKPHVLYDTVWVEPGARLTIEPGARIYVHAGSPLVVFGQLSINANTQPLDTVKENDRRTIVRFAGDRLEPFYAEGPGQWPGIQFAPGSRGNVLRYCEIKNASYGLLLYNPGNGPARPQVIVENSTIKNISGLGVTAGSGGVSFAGGGVLSFSGDVELRNVLLSNCGEYAVAGFQGGSYLLQHCTIANYTPQFRRETSALTFSNVLPVNNPPRQVSPSISILNTIVWGSIEDELFFQNASAYRAGISVSNSLLRTKEYAGPAGGATLGFEGSGNLLNVDPKFHRTTLSAGPNGPDYRLDPSSPARARGADIRAFDALSRDLRNVLRPNLATPDLGALTLP
ncbi:right-handed parallel beta-helix repeat-containing protein [Hymenobacter sp. B81]|uniref:right-handed parallel beta-helix repeat-containing protein n=1 Tax=Hymenobacter sp. B81 TaxID=3344878 RepID=UPI0037DD2FD2